MGARRLKWRTHMAITRAVCSKLGIQVAKEIANASVLPDKDPDYVYRVRWGKKRARVRRGRVSHHGREALDLAFNYLKKARKAYMFCCFFKVFSSRGSSL